MNTPLSVSELLFKIKDSLERGFPRVLVEGEIINLSSSSSGHWYFTLSDEESSLSCVLFRQDAAKNPVISKLADGRRVVCSGMIGVYKKRGVFQLIARAIVPVGAGTLKERFESLKKKLAAEGLFDLTAKKKIPGFPSRVAVITALKGAALQDFLNVARRRSFFMDVLVVPALVQGEKAPEDLRDAVDRTVAYSKKKKIDLIVLTRGGGALEDLWAFNDEQLVRKIFECPLPVISAVGHQVDFTLSDFVADARCETPSAAAEMVTNRQYHLKEKLEGLEKKLKSFGKIHLLNKSSLLKEHHPRVILHKIREDFLEKRQDLARLDLNKVPGLKLYEKQIGLDEIHSRLTRSMNGHLSFCKEKSLRLFGLLEAVNPSNVMKRGFSYLKGEQGLIVDMDSFVKTNPSEVLNVCFHDGVGRVKKEER